MMVECKLEQNQLQIKYLPPPCFRFCFHFRWQCRRGHFDGLLEEGKEVHLRLHLCFHLSSPLLSLILALALALHLHFCFRLCFWSQCRRGQCEGSRGKIA